MPERVRRCFAEHHRGPTPGVFFAPGRINLIGAHLDYSGGDVMPLAVDLGVYVAARTNADGRLRLRSLDQEVVVDVPVAALGERRDPDHGWASYPLGVLRIFRDETGVGGGVDLVFGGDLPMASGMSSSAAIEVATAFALDALHDTGLDALALARIAHRAETDYVHVQCGIMDQFASALARPGHALLLHCHDATFEHVEMRGSGFEILVMDSRKPRMLANSAFNERVRECREAHEILRRHARDLPYLAAYQAADLERAGDALTGKHRMRARHVIEEMVRVRRAVQALREGDVAAFGAMLTESHRSTSIHYEVSCEELDALTSLACEQPGVFGARLTGAGFGGCAIALIEPGTARGVEAPVAAAFTARFGVEPRFMVLHAGGGPRRIE